MIRKTFMAVLLAITFTTVGRADELPVSRFAADGLTGWYGKTFKGSTDYQLVQDNGRTVIRAQSRGSASGMFKKVNQDPQRFRYLRWSWKVAGIIEKGDERYKSGDDYAARIYVVFPGRFFWQTRAISYIWANRLGVGQATPNAFTGNVMMVAVESGPARTGQWLTEERDVLADYRRFFGEEPRKIGAIAIMTDTDNTGSEATAWYGDIVISTGK